ncbi:portal protein [Yersinia phage vB_YenM_P744]
MNWIKKWLGKDRITEALQQRVDTLEKMLDEKPPKHEYSTHVQRKPLDLDKVSEVAFPVQVAKVKNTEGKAMDEACVNIPEAGYRFTQRGGVPDNIIGWFLSQSFIGYQMAATMSQQWLINRACKIPPEDATRNGWKITGVTPEEQKELEELDSAWSMKLKCQEFARFNRVFGIRIAIFCVDSDDENYYSKPFNIDSVSPGSYRGISQVDPNWCSPEFDMKDVSDPSSASFYEPTWWYIVGKKYHKSHLCVIRYAEVPDLLKPTYCFGGIPLPQLIWERVYCAERSANEGPQLLMTKRMNVINTDLDAAAADPIKYAEKQQMAAESRDNYGFMNLGMGDIYSQHETSLSDFDAVTMTEYQLVAGVAEMPSTKLLGTSPKGFNPTGEFETASYRETLATIQEHHCDPLLQHHYMLACRSMGIDEKVVIVWNPLDEPTEAEQATTGLAKAQTAQVWQTMGVVSAEENRVRLDNDEASGYDFTTKVGDDGPDDELTAAILALAPREAVRESAIPINPVDESGSKV